ncbi:MAG TPA: ATP-grasp domain-containing protein [Terriglobia bacterium]|nr:ATP-grasp domain-containing protein [Terriglobia bacterium]
MPAPEAHNQETRRLLLLATTTGYQTRAFVEAAAKAGVSVVFGTDRCRVLDDPWQDHALPLRFEDPEESARRIAERARTEPLDGIVALGDCTPPTAARAGRTLGLLCHSPEAADICRDKYRSRRLFSAQGLNVPRFVRFPLEGDPAEIVKSAASAFAYPCVLKPLALSASQGVIRADNPREFINAFKRIQALLRSPEIRVMRQPTSEFVQVEAYVEGMEIAVEGLVDRGRVKVLAIFDKPDPLTGPYFGETIYVTPSRLPQATQARVANTLARAAEALGLHHGPLHAELRINSEGIWILEVAARPIGGLCSRVLSFHSPGLGENISLEELIVRLALGEPMEGIHRENSASGVMMIPVPGAGILQEVKGVEEARATPGIEGIIMTAGPNQKLVPLPEGSSYPGFIFARGPSPQFVEQALRDAHRKLHFVMSPALPVI